jgi:DNA-binding GntR family transcriptional regulator
MASMIASSKDRAYAHIREKMLDGGLPAGTKLSEVTLAKEIGVSRTPVREAMSQLETEGLIEQIPRLGSFVRKLERRELQELYEIRECMEGYAVSKAAERITAAQLDEIQQLCDHHHTLVRHFRDFGEGAFPADLVKQWVMTDVAFHMLLVRASGSDRVAKIVSDFRILTNLVGHNRKPPDRTFLKSFARTWGEHVRIVRALRRRDGTAARRLVEHHISLAREGALENFDRGRAAQSKPGSADWPESVRRIISQMEQYGR